MSMTSAAPSVCAPAGDGLASLCYEAERDDTLWAALRANLEWNEPAFQRLVAAVPPALEALRGRDEVPRWLLSFLVFQLHGCLGMMGSPLLDAPAAQGLDAPARAAWLDARRAFLRATLDAFAGDRPLRAVTLAAVAARRRGPGRTA